MKNIVPDYHLDMVGEPCPYPAVATLEAMPQLKKGEILEVVSDCPQSISGGFYVWTLCPIPNA